MSQVQTTFFGKKILKSVDGVLSVFNKAIADLEAVQQQHTDHATETRDKIEALHAEASASEAEVVKASRVLGKLKDLLVG